MKIILLVLITFFSCGLRAQISLQEKLGYSKNSKLLIIHADDLGVSHAENEASIYAMEHGSVNSASIMVPCPWLGEIAAYARTHPTADLGLHLTLTSEWKYYKWGPVYPKEKIPALVNPNGFLFESVDSVQRSASAVEVERELRAQIERAKQFGIDFTHFDSHMGTLFGTEPYLRTLIKLGREYKVPVLLSKPAMQLGFGLNLDQFTNTKDVVIDNIYTATPDNYKTGLDNYYTGVLQALPAGVHVILLHAAYNDREMQAVTIDHPEWGAAWRQADFDFFTSDACKKLLKEQQIKLVTWREIRDKLLR
jgi:chitin disaccharide deacetylase